MAASPWREPDEESIDLFPHLVVHDGRQGGAITFGCTRLPVYAPQWSVLDLDDYAQPGDPRKEWQEAAEQFVRLLLHQQGEFGRLLLVLADTLRRQHEAMDDSLDTHWDEVHPEADMCDCLPDLPPAWWDDAELRRPVVDQLRRCLAALDADVLTKEGDR